MTDKECEIETSKAIMEMRNIIAELEKENAELQEKNGYLLSLRGAILQKKRHNARKNAKKMTIRV